MPDALLDLADFIRDQGLNAAACKGVLARLAAPADMKALASRP